MSEPTTILAPDGSLATMDTVVLDQQEAELLRAYKVFLQKRGLREALYCNACWDRQSMMDGCEAHVTPHQILIKCRCTTRFYQGQTF